MPIREWATAGVIYFYVLSKYHYKRITEEAHQLKHIDMNIFLRIMAIEIEPVHTKFSFLFSHNFMYDIVVPLCANNYHDVIEVSPRTIYQALVVSALLAQNRKK